jgi:hypothetical protein
MQRPQGEWRDDGRCWNRTGHEYPGSLVHDERPDLKLHERQGATPTNFTLALPQPSLLMVA